jgi:hypothetical protein
MSAPQKGYRVYAYDGERKTVMSDWIHAESDDEAIAQASEFAFTKAELWLQDRLVAQLGGQQRTA